MRRRTLWVNVGIGVAIAAVLGLIVVSLRPSSQAPEQRTVTVAPGRRDRNRHRERHG